MLTVITKFNQVFAFSVLIALSSAFAHDTGFNHSFRTMHIQIKENLLRIEVRLAIPADQAWLGMAQMDKDRNGKISDDEMKEHLGASAKKYLGNLKLKGANGEVELELNKVSHDSSLSHNYVFSAKAKGPFSLEDTNFIDLAGSLRLLTDNETRVEMKNQGDLNHVESITLKIKRSN